MRFGRWHHVRELLVLERYLEDAIVVYLDDLFTPAALAHAIAPHIAKLTADDVLHLHIAANELMWKCFDYSGIGDWVDETGAPRGACTAPKNTATTATTV